MRAHPDAVMHYMEQEVPFNHFLGLRGESCTSGHCVLTLAVRPEFVGDKDRPALHGGVLSALIDAAGGLAAWSALEHGQSVSTIDLRIDYLQPAGLEGLLRAEADLIRRGNRVCQVKVVVEQQGRAVAEGRGVYNIHRRQGAAEE